ncbi:type I restriction endonuclease [Aeromonas sobria]|uniref:type I restriction endonuclease n=1 Tax=Aeromonas TaxID=642 RepID=UPI001C12C80A|nr:type I restriction endonuclease [Aeromonas sobria]
MQSELSSLLENRRIHKLMTEGMDVQHYVNNCTVIAGKAALINFEQPEQNDLLAVSQLW